MAEETKIATGDDTKVEGEIKTDAWTTDGEIVEIIAQDPVTAESEYTETEYRRLRWKIDLWLLPLMWVSRLLMDRNTPIDGTGIDSAVVLLWHATGRQDIS